MFSLVLSLLMLLASVGIFFGYIEGAYARWQALKSEYEQIVEVNKNYQTFDQQFQNLIAQKNALSAETARLQKLLPDHVDMIRLILDLEAIADRHEKVTIGDFSFSQQGGGGSVSSNLPAEGTGSSATGSEVRYGRATIQFTVEAPYEEGLAFLRDVERSLRLLDITRMEVKPGGSSTANTTTANNAIDTTGSPYTFTVSATTYWLP